MDDARKSIIERLKKANNVLITVSRNPSVDQLSAMIGLALFLNRLNKHASAVFSGSVPDVINFLEPGKTIEDSTDSLRDFIISLDKSKADKLRYKVEDDYVRIYVTPYRTSIRQEDLNFSQGDFNVDAIVTIGVLDRDELDDAITSHGRVLHDAAILSISREQTHDFGTLNLIDTNASSYCEILAVIANTIKETGFDEQIATAFLTGIVAETERFSNEKTVATTMAVSAKLLSVGANQQLVAESLAPKPEPIPEPIPEPGPIPDQAWEESATGGEVLPQDTAGSVHDAGISPPVENGYMGPDTLNSQEDFTLPPIQPETSIESPVAQPPVVEEEEPPKPNDGSLYISHDIDLEENDENEQEDSGINQIHIDEQGMIRNVGDEALADVSPAAPATEMPAEQAELTAPEQPQDSDNFEPLPVSDPVSAPAPSEEITAQGQPEIEDDLSLPPQAPEEEIPEIVKPPAHTVLADPSPPQAGPIQGPPVFGGGAPSEDEDMSIDPLSEGPRVGNVPLLSHDTGVTEPTAPTPAPSDRPPFNPMDFIPTEDSHFPANDTVVTPPANDQSALQDAQASSSANPFEQGVQAAQPVPPPPGESLLDLEAAVSDRSDPTHEAAVQERPALANDSMPVTQAPRVVDDGNGPVIGLSSQASNFGFPGEGSALEEVPAGQDQNIIRPTQQPAMPSNELRPPGFPPPLMPSQGPVMPSSQGPQPQNPMSY